MRYPFIALEGVDGSGKSTLVAALDKRLQLFNDVHVMAFPSRLTPAGQYMRKCLATGKPLPPGAVYHMLADMADLTPTIEERLKTGFVLADRYVMSSAVYQNNVLGMLDGRIIIPDLTIYCKAPIDRLVDVAAKRGGAKGASVFDMADERTLRARAAAYETVLEDASAFSRTTYTIQVDRPTEALVDYLFPVIFSLCLT